MSNHKRKQKTLWYKNEPVLPTPSPQEKRPPIVKNPESRHARKRKITGRDATMKQLLVIEQRKLDHFEHTSEQHEDDDTHFVLSLVPYIKQLPSHRKLYVQKKFQELVMKEHELLITGYYTRYYRYSNFTPTSSVYPSTNAFSCLQVYFNRFFTTTQMIPPLLH